LRLSHIKLAGFKSFVDPTEIPVPGDLVGVVGPNGCGKSNVIDAVRWVLGESRASALRGESMQDVIFNGSANRKPVGRASVELIFDNSLGRAAGPWSSYAHISIKRILRRDGESTYHINNIHVRRRDVADIFLGTGIGGRGYAIIEQGMISRIIEAKPEELRVFLEEAAGVSKYRERRRETELRLADTSENLLRVGDICHELEKQLLRLEQQAKIASLFKEMNAQLQRTQNLLWFARKQEAAAQRALAERELQSTQTALEAEAARLRDAETRLEEKRAQHYAAGDHMHQAQGELYAVNAEIAHVEQQIRHLRESCERVAQQIESTSSQLGHREKQAEEAASSLIQWRAKLEQARLVHEANKRKAAAENEKVPQAEAAFRICQEKLAETKHHLMLIEQAGRLEENHRVYAEKSLQQLELRRKRLLAEQDALPAPNLEQLSDLNREAEGSAIDLEQKRELLAQTEELFLNAEEARSACANKVQRLHQQAVQADARLTALQRLQHRLEGSERLSAWLVKHKLDALPRLWQCIQIEKGWEDALEAVLRERLNSVQLEKLESLHDWTSDPPPAKWAVHEATSREPEGEQAQEFAHEPLYEPLHGRQERPRLGNRNLMPLQSYISCDDDGLKGVVEEWLGGVFVVGSVHESVSSRTSLSTGEMLVTREGHIVTRHSLTYYAPDSQLHGVLGRQREIAQIKLESDGLKEYLSVEKSALEAAEEARQELESAVSALRFDIGQLQQQRHDFQMQALKLTQLSERASQRGSQIEGEVAEIEQQAGLESSRRRDAEIKLGEYGTRIELLRNQVQQEKLAGHTAELALNVQRQLAQNAVREMQEASFHEKTCHNKIAEVENSIRIVDENLVELRAQLQKLQTEQSGFDDTRLGMRLQEWLTLRAQREQALAAARGALEDAAAGLRNIEQERLTSEQKLHPLRESINIARLKEQEARITENQFDEHLKESEAPEEALIQALGKTRPAALQAEINRLNNEISSLGAVNLGALEELQSSQARKGYLDSQLNDLKEASETLRDAIRRIDVETRERLLETVEKVNANLNEMFPTMFGGGQAKLLLRGEEILDSGVQIIAQPPGKKNSSIHLLSGGEKALTALAFVFSLFQLNPAPFCLLDEVDAPLDDTNTERFCNLVKKMSRQTQFIFISHNKITMEMAQQLIGITMQEKGISRVVAVEIEEAARLGSVPPRTGRAW
jgi:chromosome segregation protein